MLHVIDSYVPGNGVLSIVTDPPPSFAEHDTTSIFFVPQYMHDLRMTSYFMVDEDYSPTPHRGG